MTHERETWLRTWDMTHERKKSGHKVLSNTPRATWFVNERHDSWTWDMTRFRKTLLIHMKKRSTKCSRILHVRNDSWTSDMTHFHGTWLIPKKTRIKSEMPSSSQSGEQCMCDMTHARETWFILIRHDSTTWETRNSEKCLWAHKAENNSCATWITWITWITWFMHKHADTGSFACVYIAQVHNSCAYVSMSHVNMFPGLAAGLYIYVYIYIYIYINVYMYIYGCGTYVYVMPTSAYSGWFETYMQNDYIYIYIYIYMRI